MDAKLRDELGQFCRDGAIAGLVAMATDGERTLFAEAFGVRRLGDPAPMTLDSRFWIASMTKAITTVAALQLVEQGRVGLHQPLGEVVPALAGKQVLEGFDDAGQPRLRPARSDLTLHHLLTHTSGFVYEMWNPDYIRYQEATGAPSIRSGLNAALDMPLAFDPGERWEYGISTDWAGKVVEAVSGETLGAYLKAHVLGPLGMDSTGFEPGSDSAAAIHARGPDGALTPAPAVVPPTPELESGGGGLFSTGPDYLKFLAMVLNGGRAGENVILRPETLALMAQDQIAGVDTIRMTDVLPLLPPGVTPAAIGMGWTYGFITNGMAVPAGRSAHSLAWAGLANTYYWIDPARKVAGLILAQVLPFNDPVVLTALVTLESGVYRTLG